MHSSWNLQVHKEKADIFNLLYVQPKQSTEQNNYLTRPFLIVCCPEDHFFVPLLRCWKNLLIEPKLHLM